MHQQTRKTTLFTLIGALFITLFVALTADDGKTSVAAYLLLFIILCEPEMFLYKYLRSKFRKKKEEWNRENT